VKLRLTKGDSWAEYESRSSRVFYLDSKGTRHHWDYESAGKANEAFLEKVQGARALGLKI